MPLRSTRTALPRLAAALAGAALIAGCGATAEPDRAAAPTRTVTDAAGTAVTVPATAARVVTFGENELDMALSLGVPVVGTSSARGTAAAPVYLGDRARGVAVVGTVGDANLEAVAGQRPDVILVGATTSLAAPEPLARLRAIAPTVVTSKPGEKWTAVLDRVAAATGTADRVPAVTAADAEKVRAASAAVGSTPGTAGVVRWSGAGPLYMLSGNAAVALLAEVGYARPPTQDQPGPSHSQPVSPERFDVLEADRLFVGALGADGATALQQATASPLWTRLGVVARQRVVPVDGSLWTTGVAGPNARAVMLDAITAAGR